MSNEWSERAERLTRIVGNSELSADFPLLKAVRISEPAFARLQGAAQIYMWHTLTRVHPSRTFTLGPALLRDHAAEVMALPNRTPNGVLLPRSETFQSFNLIQQALADTFEELDLLSGFSRIQIPVNVRIVSGAPDSQADNRPYSSAKTHTDVWNGEPISSVLFNIPVLGDPRAVDLSFFEAKDFPNELRSPLKDYTLGKEVVASAREYPVSFDMGSMYLSDSLSLHQTRRRRPELRLSLDLRAIARELLPGESADDMGLRAVYVEPNVWRAAGSTVVLGSGDPLRAFHRRQMGETVTRKPLSIMNIDDLS